MSSFYAKISRAAANADGSTAVEYGLLAALLAVALISILLATGGSTEAMWDYVVQQYKNASGP